MVNHNAARWARCLYAFKKKRKTKRNSSSGNYFGAFLPTGEEQCVGCADQSGQRLNGISRTFGRSASR
jgi:hypothetical protein